MADPDLILTDAEVHPMTDPDRTASALAVRDGQITALGTTASVRAEASPDTRHVDGEGRVVLPGFVDAHTHLESTGRYLVHADLSSADTLEDAVEILERDAADDQEWLLGFGYDESEWDDGRYLTRTDLDRVSERRPVAATRVDMHTASLNSVALERLADAMPEGDVRTDAGEPTGVIVEDAVGALRSATEPDRAETRALVEAARDHAHELGVTAIHDMVRGSHAPRVYRDLAAEDALDLRVRINYWSDHLDAVEETGLRTDAGSDFVQVGAIKSFTDGSIGGRTAKVGEPYADAECPAASEGEVDRGRNADTDDGENGSSATGQWVVDPADLRDLVERVDGNDLQLTIHAIGDEAIGETVDALADCDDPDASRHRIEHVELATDDQLERMAEAGIVASCQPNFLRWAEEGGLYDQRLGEDRSRSSNRFRTMLDEGVRLAFGSDSMPMGPLKGVHHGVNAPAAAQRLTVTEAIRAYTRGGAVAGFDEDRFGTLEVGTSADLVVLEDSPWENPDGIRDIDVGLTMVDGEIVYEE